MKIVIVLSLVVGSMLIHFQSLIAAEKVYKKIAVKEIIKHNSKESCWIVINKSVFDVTSYISKHPAPPVIMLKYCGKDGTKGYATKGMSKPHSEKSHQLLKSYKIGQL